MADRQKRYPAVQIDGREHALRFLHPKQIVMIDEALASLEDFGEIRLVVERGRLRFVVTQHSFDALKWRPGLLGTEDA